MTTAMTIFGDYDGHYLFMMMVTRITMVTMTMLVFCEDNHECFWSIIITAIITHHPRYHQTYLRGGGPLEKVKYGQYYLMMMSMTLMMMFAVMMMTTVTMTTTAMMDSCGDGHEFVDQLSSLPRPHITVIIIKSSLERCGSGSSQGRSMFLLLMTMMTMVMILFWLLPTMTMMTAKATVMKIFAMMAMNFLGQA